MTDPASAMAKLDQHATELDSLSKRLAQVERDLEPVEAEYERFVADFEIGLWTRHESTNSRLPSEALRLKMAHRAMEPALLGRFMGLLAQRRRIEKRISALKAQVDAQRSILSALKVELEAVSS